MTNKRKSMNANDAHVLSTEVRSRRCICEGEGFRDVALTSGAPWALLAKYVELVDIL